MVYSPIKLVKIEHSIIIQEGMAYPSVAPAHQTIGMKAKTRAILEESVISDQGIESCNSDPYMDNPAYRQRDSS